MAPGAGFKPVADQAMISRPKTSNAVITRTIIDGTTDMRESPDRIVFTMASWRRGFPGNLRRREVVPPCARVLGLKSKRVLDFDGFLPARAGAGRLARMEAVDSLS